MDKDMLFGAVISLVIGFFLALFPRLIGTGFCRLGKAIWKGHDDDVFGKIDREVAKAFPSHSIAEVCDETKAPRRFRILGIVFLLQALFLFILSVFMK